MVIRLLLVTSYIAPDPDAFIITDANNYDRVSRTDGQKIRELVARNKIATTAIDHHELAGKDDFDVFINTELWRPYRTVACWHLWESLHNTPK